MEKIGQASSLVLRVGDMSTGELQLTGQAAGDEGYSGWRTSFSREVLFEIPLERFKECHLLEVDGDKTE